MNPTQPLKGRDTMKTNNSSEYRKEYKKQWRIKNLLEDKYLYEEIQTANSVFVNGSSFVTISDGLQFTQVYNLELKKAIKRIYHFADWLLPL